LPNHQNVGMAAHLRRGISCSWVPCILNWLLEWCCGKGEDRSRTFSQPQIRNPNPASTWYSQQSATWVYGR
jgi:hypothetical protein